MRALILVAVAGWFTIAVNGDSIANHAGPVPIKFDPTEKGFSRKAQRANGTLPCGVTFADYENSPMSGIAGDYYLWTNYNVFIDPAFTAGERTEFNNALYELSQVLTCVRFGIWPATSTPSGDYVHIRKGSPGYCGLSNVGRLGGRQYMDIGCIDKDTIQHETFHALGFFHEQDRPDRDDFIEVHYENMDQSNWRVYDKQTTSITYTPYDYVSIMHYQALDFSNNWKPVLVAKNGARVGSLGSMTAYDKTKLKAHYRSKGC